MNPDPSLPAGPDFQIRPLRPAELKTAAAHLTWPWHGYLASRKVTALIGDPKGGKTTLASILLARFAQGGQLANLPVMPARCFVVSG
jgi:AAA domain